MFYIKNEEKIVLFDEDKEKLTNTLAFMPKYKGLEIKETERPIVDYQFADTEEYQEQKAKEKRERFDNLSLTAADVERAIYQTKGMDFEDIIEMVKDNPLIDVKALKIELKANNFYRGNPYINQIGKLLGFNESELDYLFENGKLPEVVTENATSDDKLPM